MTPRRPPPSRERGIVLVNVLVVLALASAVVVLMLTAQERALDRVRQSASLAQAEALARGAETSVAVALRRDMAEAPEADFLGEPWAASLQQEVTLETGRFSVAVEDANARFDLNRLLARRLPDTGLFARIAAAAGLPDEAVAQIAAAVVRGGPLERLSGLEGRGIPAGDVEALRAHVDALPVEGQLNLNTMGPVVMTALLQNPATARRLLARREAEGRLERADLERVGVLSTPGAGFTSDLWDVTVQAEVDGATAELHSRLLRRPAPGGGEVVTISRAWGPPPGAQPAPPQGLD